MKFADGGRRMWAPWWTEDGGNAPAEGFWDTQFHFAEGWTIAGMLLLETRWLRR